MGSYPKDLLEEIEARTGGSYYNEYYEDAETLEHIYQRASEDLLDLVIILKRHIYEVLNNTNKYKISRETELLLKEVMDYRNKASKNICLTREEKELLKAKLDPKENELLYHKLIDD